MKGAIKMFMLSTSTSTLDMAAIVAESLTGIQSEVLSIIAVVAPVAFIITASFIGLRMALRAFRRVGS
jgi:hypothetical protein